MKSKVLIATALFITLVLILSRQTVPVSETVAAEPVTKPAPEQLAVQLAVTDAPPVIDLHEYDPQDTRFLMHEWGTFTSFSGSDGVKLEFRPLVNNDLPPFVFDRPRQAGVIPLSMMLSKGAYLSWQRMETPVIYFYTPEEMDVNVKVSFPEGLLTEFYPPVKSFSPELSEIETNLARMGSANVRSLGDMTQIAHKLKSQLKDSELDWGTITLVPPSRLKLPLENEVAARGIHDRLLRKLIPTTPQDFDYYYARDTDSAFIHTDFPHPQPMVFAPYYKPLGAFFEKFLFYRGIGNFDSLLRLQAKGNDQFVVKNLSSQPVNSLILMERNGKGKLRFVVHDVLDGKKQQELQLPEAEMGQRDLEEKIESALVNAGLFRKEARAMIATWRGSWFGETGTRMFYLLPEAQTERLLPLSIQPAPEESVRVMVGRLEIMTPDRERKIEGLLKAQTNESRQPLDPKSELGIELAALGRFAEPALSRIHSSSKEPEVKHVAEKLIERLVNGPEELWKADATATPSLPLAEDKQVKTEAGEADSGEVETAPKSN